MKQVTLSVTIYHKRPEFLISALRELFNIINLDRDHGFNSNFICDVSVCLCHSQVRQGGGNLRE